MRLDRTVTAPATTTTITTKVTAETAIIIIITTTITETLNSNINNIKRIDLAKCNGMDDAMPTNL